jgi:hypothetical protein
MCGNGSGRAEHPIEMLGEDWYKDEGWGMNPEGEMEKSGPLPFEVLP